MIYPAHRLRGFSLLELIVSLALFSIVMLIVISTYLALISYDREARATNQLVANLSFAVESMVRNMRTGKNYSCTGNPCTSFSFTDSGGQAVTYSSSGGALTQGSVALTAPGITISTLSFYLKGAPSTVDGIQPQVTVLIKGTMGTGAGKTSTFSIQTAATQRLIDI
jgi:prepilin-type N-terminal cleavage/methylation domain-containing protein